MEAGFEEANSANLPKVDHEMVDLYYRQNADYLIAGVQHVKAQRSGRPTYVDDAVGYVQLKREFPVCIVKARLTPEHRIRQKGYLVSATINEEEEEIVDCKCHDCAASEGGCKHAIALVYWLLKRSDQPSVTSTVCYWKKPTLSKVSTLEPIRIATISKKAIAPLPPKSESFLNTIVKTGTEEASEGSLFKLFQTVNSLVEDVSLFHLMLKFQARSGSGSAGDFITFCKDILNPQLCHKVNVATVKQSACAEWFAVRFGRITASKIHEVAQCQTIDGTLTETVLGASKFVQTEAMKRGLILEKEVIKTICERRSIISKKSGMVLKKDYPIFGASPDAITDDLCIEVKCPLKASTVQNYIKNGKIMPKPYAQIQLQMFLCEKAKGLFCVASPRFETDRKVEVVEVELNVQFCKSIIAKAEEFWKQAIYPKLV